MILNNAGQADVAKNEVWPLVKFDMEWVVANWDSEGCDLWEEVRSRDFYFNRAGFVYSLNIAANFADMIGYNGVEPQQYRSKANEILETTKSHYGKFGDFIFESENRQQDGSVIHSIATFGEYTAYGPSSNEAAATIATLAKTFCREYKINQEAINMGKSGILIGRYPGDHYAGGNPWQLLTAVLAETFYLGAQATLENIEEKGDYNLNEVENREWIKLLDTFKDGHVIVTAQDLATAQLAAGDSVMSRLWEHVKDDGGRVDEQIDRNTGAQASAQSLTWSYANTLHALHTRKHLMTLFQKLMA